MQVRVSLWSLPKARIRCLCGQHLARYSGKPEPMRVVTCAVHSWLSRWRMLRPMPVSSQMLNVSTFSAMQSMTFRTAVAMRPQCSVGGRCRLPFLPRGNSPALAQRLRAELGEQFGEQYGPWVQQLGEVRRVVFQDKTISNENRRNILHKQAGAEAFEAYRAAHQRTSASQDCVRSAEGARKSS